MTTVAVFRGQTFQAPRSDYFACVVAESTQASRDALCESLRQKIREAKSRFNQLKTGPETVEDWCQGADAVEAAFLAADTALRTALHDGAWARIMTLYTEAREAREAFYSTLSPEAHRCLDTICITRRNLESVPPVGTLCAVSWHYSEVAANISAGNYLRRLPLLKAHVVLTTKQSSAV